jgi:uncharacterized YigZ family protein
MLVDRYRTVREAGEGLLREKASRFLGFAFHVDDEADFAQQYAAIAREHHTSRHLCSAWVLGDQGERFRTNDAGEPAGTAGRPILHHIQGAQLTYCAVVVVRYFGGSLLGKGGLVQAYGGAARLALANATVMEQVIRISLSVSCTYAQLDHIREDIARCEGMIVHAVYGEPCVLRIAIARGQADSFTARWALAGADVERIS